MILNTDKISIIGDSLGMPRTAEMGDVPKEVTWPTILKKILNKKKYNVSIESDCIRARTMDTVPVSMEKAIASGAKLIIIQVGVVDCAPRIFSREDKKAFSLIRDDLRHILLKYINKNRIDIIKSLPECVYTKLEKYKEYALQSALIGDKNNVRTIFISSSIAQNMTLKNPFFFENIKKYNLALKEVCSTVATSEFLDLDQYIIDSGHDNVYFTSDMHHLSPQGNAFLAFILSDFLITFHEESKTNDIQMKFFKKLTKDKKTLNANIVSLSREEREQHSHRILELIPKSNAKQKFIRTKKNTPTWAFIEITNKCNLNCLMCNTQLSKRKKGFMSPDLFEKIVMGLQSAGVNAGALHTVGETLLHPHLGEILSIAEKRNFYTMVSTNGQLVSNLTQLLPKHSKQIGNVRFSIDAATPETYSLIRRGGKIERVWESMEQIHKINKTNSQKCGMSTNFIVSDTNKNEINQFIDIVKNYTETSKMKFHPPNSLSPDPSFLQEIIPFKNLLYPTHANCDLPFRCVAITFNGKVSLCCRDYDEELVIGSIIEDNLINIWNNEKARSIRKSMHGNEELPNLCKKCYSVACGNIFTPFIHSAFHLGLPDIGERIWSLLQTIDKDITDIASIREATVHALE